MSGAQTILQKTAAATTQTSGEFINKGKGMMFVLDITAVSGTPTLDLTIEIKDGLTGTWIALAGAAFAQKTTTGTSMLTIYPGIAETANVSVSDRMPASFRAVATIGGTTPTFTFTLSAEELT